MCIKLLSNGYNKGISVKQVKCSENIHLIRVAAVRHTWLYPCRFLLHFIWITLLPCDSQRQYQRMIQVCVCVGAACLHLLHTLQSPLSIAFLDFVRPLCTATQTRELSLNARSEVIGRNTLPSCNKHTVSHWTMSKVRYSCYQSGCRGWDRKEREINRGMVGAWSPLCSEAIHIKLACWLNASQVALSMKCAFTGCFT